MRGDGTAGRAMPFAVAFSLNLYEGERLSSRVSVQFLYPLFWATETTWHLNEEHTAEQNCLAHGDPEVKKEERPGSPQRAYTQAPVTALLPSLLPKSWWSIFKGFPSLKSSNIVEKLRPEYLVRLKAILLRASGNPNPSTIFTVYKGVRQTFSLQKGGIGTREGKIRPKD